MPEFVRMQIECTNDNPARLFSTNNFVDALRRAVGEVRWGVCGPHRTICLLIPADHLEAVVKMFSRRREGEITVLLGWKYVKFPPKVPGGSPRIIMGKRVMAEERASEPFGVHHHKIGTSPRRPRMRQ